MKNSPQESQATVSGNLANQMRPIQHGNTEPGAMTQRRYDALIDAANRGIYIWTIEGESERVDDAKRALYMLSTRFPLQHKARIEGLEAGS